MVIRLRPHHLLCMLTYIGKGYSPAFTANYDVIAGRLAKGERIVIVSGPDDICAPLLNEAEPHCWNESVKERDALAARDVGALLGVPIRDGATLALDAEILNRMRDAFSVKSIRPACTGCEWSGLCGTIAANGFEDVLVAASS